MGLNRRVRFKLVVKLVVLGLVLVVVGLVLVIFCVLVAARGLFEFQFLRVFGFVCKGG